MESQGMSLVEICRLILDRTRAWQDIDALPAEPARLTARLNLHRLLDLAEDWSPLSGRPIADGLPRLPGPDGRRTGRGARLGTSIRRGRGDPGHSPPGQGPRVGCGRRARPSSTGTSPSRSAIPRPGPVRPSTCPSSIGSTPLWPGCPADEKARSDYLRRATRFAGVAEPRMSLRPGPDRRSMVTGSYWYGLPEPSINGQEAVGAVRPRRAAPGDPGRGSRRRARAAGTSPLGCGRTTPDPLFAEGWAAPCGRPSTDDQRPSLEVAQGLGVADAYQDTVEAVAADPIRPRRGRSDCLGARKARAGVGHRLGHLCPVPEAVLLVRGRPAPPPPQPRRDRGNRGSIAGSSSISEDRSPSRISSRGFTT